MYQSNQKLKERYHWLNRNWVSLPAKLQLSATQEMNEIKSTLAKRGTTV